MGPTWEVYALQAYGGMNSIPQAAVHYLYDKCMDWSAGQG